MLSAKGVYSNKKGTCIYFMYNYTKYMFIVKIIFNQNSWQGEQRILCFLNIIPFANEVQQILMVKLLFWVHSI